MRFRVRRPFTWENRRFQRGDVIELPDGHPRINGMLMGRYITYEAGDTPPANSLESQTPNEQATQRLNPVQEAVRQAQQSG